MVLTEVTSPIVSPLDLSFAELAVLMSLTDESLSAAACSRLGIPVVSVHSDLARAGISSLLLRGLAVQRDATIHVSPEVAAVAMGVLTPSSSASVAIRTGNNLEILQVLIGDAQSLAIQPRSGNCFRFGGLDETVTLASVVLALLADGKKPPGIAVIRLGGSVSAVGVRRAADGGFDVVCDGAKTHVAASDELWAVVESMGGAADADRP
jgi:hypothetical protein